MAALVNHVFGLFNDLFGSRNRRKDLGDCKHVSAPNVTEVVQATNVGDGVCGGYPHFD